MLPQSSKDRHRDDSQQPMNGGGNGRLVLKTRHAAEALLQGRDVRGLRVRERVEANGTRTDVSAVVESNGSQGLRFKSSVAAAEGQGTTESSSGQAKVRLRIGTTLPAEAKTDLLHHESGNASVPARAPKSEHVVPPGADPTAPSPAQSTSADNRTPTGGQIKLRRKTDSVLEGRRDVSLVPVEKPVCCNCHVRFAVGPEFPLLSRIACPRCGTKQIVPARIENFVLETQLGSGGMGITYRAFDESLHRNVAIKLISGERASNQRHIEGMVREARRAAGLSHPHIVPIYSIGSVAGAPYIVMELLSDALLSRPVLRNRLMDERFVLETALAVAKALAATAELGILHLDIKPANILHDKFGVAKLIDFGLACHWEEDSSKGLGTCLYMAPERLRRDGQDFRCDQYSLGMTMWQALAGRAPFEAPTLEDLVGVILKQAPEALNHIRPDLHRWTSGLIHKMAAYEAADRYHTYDELIRAIEMVLEALDEKAAPPKAAAP